MKNPNTKKYWDKEFKNGKFGAARHALRRIKGYHFLANILPRNEEFSLFEIGCAFGHGLKWIEEHFPLAKLYGLDFSKVAIRRARKKYPSINFEIEDIQNYKFIRKYSYITIIRTLEHLTEPFAILDECLKYATNAVIINLPSGDSACHFLHINLFHLHDFDNYVFDEYSKEGLKLIIYGRKNI